ncbi:phosphoesterase [Halobacteriales archaeon QS_4_62_28]|nr:MAG: phosphoesterase [Halobacteriales archaeon QS_4_62_28]
MYSLNVPVPSEVARLALDLAREVPTVTPRRRGEHTLVVKRLGADGRPPNVIEARTREVLAGEPPVAVRITGVDWFPEPTSGPGPVLYLAVESPGLRALHERLCAVFDPVPDVEGDAYTPHVTIARGGDREATRRLCERDIEPIEWVVDELELYDAERSLASGTVALSG